jgi:hypothetical protein
MQYAEQSADPLEHQHFRDVTATVSHAEAARQDAYWCRSYWRERYYTLGLDYEDYAPAYFVGYIGYAQYGGEFDDAEPWLCSNWERIRGDSRLGLADARLAMRSAWQRLSAERACGAGVSRTGDPARVTAPMSPSGRTSVALDATIRG